MHWRLDFSAKNLVSSKSKYVILATYKPTSALYLIENLYSYDTASRPSF